MNLAQVLIQIQRFGARLDATDGRLIVQAITLLPEFLVAQLRTHKAELIDLLQLLDHDACDPAFADWHERAAIMEYDGGMSRADAEIAAWMCVPTSTKLH